MLLVLKGLWEQCEAENSRKYRKIYSSTENIRNRCGIGLNPFPPDFAGSAVQNPSVWWHDPQLGMWQCAPASFLVIEKNKKCGYNTLYIGLSHYYPIILHYYPINSDHIMG